jgi:hypothetical protein
LKRFVLSFLAGLFFLLAQQGAEVYSHEPAVSDATTVVTGTAAEFPTRAPADVRQALKPMRVYFKHRPVALNDGHDEALNVIFYDIRPEFVYIHTCYHSYVQTFISVAIDLSDWRGPPHNA